MLLFDSSGQLAFDTLADEARAKGIPTACAGKFAYKLEKEREYGFAIAEEAGIWLPPYEEFGSFTEALKFAHELEDEGSYFKSDRYVAADATHGASNGPEMVQYLEGLIEQYGGHGRCILQKKLEGVAYSTARWWNGMSWCGPYFGEYENKKFMNDNVGSATGCSFNAVWVYDETPKIAEMLQFENLAAIFRREKAPPGIYDINALVTDEGDAYFLEWTPRLGYDSETTAFRLYGNLGKHLYGVAAAGEMPEYSNALAYSIRLSVPPYPWEGARHEYKDVPVGAQVHGIDGFWDGHFIPYVIKLNDREQPVIASPEAIVGLSLAVGNDIEELHEACVEYAKDDLRVSGMSLQYRTDGAKDCREAAEKLVTAGLDVHDGLL
jgi:phosphoribosylamine-glycine ligase